MNKTTRQAILDQQALNRKIYNKENPTTEDIQQERIDVLNETIDVMNRIIKIDKEHKQHLNETISNQAKQLQVLYNRIEIDKQTIKIQSETINNYLKSKSNE
tara:strand:- start:220 stop:525 length:306 start_codon:yes stop_codon:yes gene_type:complete